MDTLRPLLLAVHRACSGHAAQVPAGKRTVLPGSNGMLTPAGQVSCPAAKPRVNWSLANRPQALRTRQALQKMARSGPRSRTSAGGRVQLQVDVQLGQVPPGSLQVGYDIAGDAGLRRVGPG